ncbi:MAG: hypothetical protein EZS28_044786 [Streblomastix strix]|uniref:Uncharacterized protein n=1 Tax=Streblomastix strix TaxID=222440 RepID=A0A5J4TMX7_9EUKA|nr:MAG: hypothetical protein EZS28_044786 [Streblomastix strix]
MEPSSETLAMLEESGILFRQYDTCTWVLRNPPEEDPVKFKPLFKDALSILRFELKNNNSDFYFYTQKEITISKNNNWRYCSVESPHILGQIEILLTKELLAKRETIKLNFETKKKFWEYLLMPKSTPKEMTLRLFEKKNQLSFNFIEMVDIDVSGKQMPAYRFVTNKRVQLKDIYDFNISLWNVTVEGDQLLSSNMPNPQAQSISKFDPENTITCTYSIQKNSMVPVVHLANISRSH